MSNNANTYFWSGKRVFLTGHTGFKGSWLSLWLSSMGAEVTGYSLAPNTEQNLYEILRLEAFLKKSIIGDIRDLNNLKKELLNARPEVVIHMAAQPLVRYSYENPVETYSTNVMGTVNLLESVRHSDTVRSTLVVTTDKCYENREWVWGYREYEPMGGYDPYSNSKGCAELVCSAYRQSYFTSNGDGKPSNSLATARAGNVIGGGDWSTDRLIPDALRALETDETLLLRNPKSTRPWQHVLEPLSGYLLLAQKLYLNGQKFASAWNFGPNDEDTRSVGEVIDLLGQGLGGALRWKTDSTNQPHEANLLKLDCSKARVELGWTPKWNLECAISHIVNWHQAFKSSSDMQSFTLNQINQYMSQ